MRYIAAQSAVYARTENTALPGSRRSTPRHNISAYVSRRMQMPDRDIATQSNHIIYPPPKASPDTENYTKKPAKIRNYPGKQTLLRTTQSRNARAHRTICRKHIHTPSDDPQHNAPGRRHTYAKKRAAHSRYSDTQFKSNSITPVIVKKHTAQPHLFVTTPCNRTPKQTENSLVFCKNRPQ